MSISPLKKRQVQCVTIDEALKVLNDVADEIAAERISRGYPTMVLRRWLLATALARDDGLWRVMLEASRCAESMVLFLKGSEFPNLVPAELHACPLWLIRLPSVLEPYVDAMASESWSSVVRFSKDLTQAHVHAELAVGTVNVQFVFTGLESTLPDIRGDELPCVLMMIASGRSLVLSLYPVTEGVEMGLCGCGSCAGANYRPHRLFTDAEMEAAKELAKREGPDEPIIADDGAVDLPLRRYLWKTQ